MHELRLGLRLIQPHDVEQARLERHLDQAGGEPGLLDFKEIAGSLVCPDDAILVVEQERHHGGVLQQLGKKIARWKVWLEWRAVAPPVPDHGRSI